MQCERYLFDSTPHELASARRGWLCTRTADTPACVPKLHWFSQLLMTVHKAKPRQGGRRSRRPDLDNVEDEATVPTPTTNARPKASMIARINNIEALLC